MSWSWSNVTNATPSLLNNSVREIQADSTGQYILVNGGTNGVYRSTDYGATWSRPSEFSGLMCSASCVSYSGAVMYAGMIDTNANTITLYYSTNQGASWTACTNQPSLGSNFNMSGMCCKSDGTHLVFTTPYQGGPGPQYSIIYYNPSPATTGSWAVSNIDGNVAVACFSIACNPSATQYVAVMPAINGNSSGVYTSTNYGQTWTKNTDASVTDNTAMWASVICSGDGSTFIATNSGHWTGSGNPPMTYDGAIFKATNPTGAWSAVSAFSNYVGSSFAPGFVACNNDATNIFVSTQPKSQTSLAHEGICYSINGNSSTYDSLDGQSLYLGYILLNSQGTQPSLVGIQFVDSGDFYGMLTTGGGGGAACFLEGTKILTEEGYKPIESLRVGDMVKTLKSGYKPVVVIGTSKIYNNGTSERTREKLYRYPEGLVVTGGHSALADEISNKHWSAVRKALGGIFVTEGKVRIPAMVDEERATPYPVRGEFSIYNFALESPFQTSNYGIYADGVLVESSFPYWIKKTMMPIPEFTPCATASASSDGLCAGT